MQIQPSRLKSVPLSCNSSLERTRKEKGAKLVHRRARRSAQALGDMKKVISFHVLVVIGFVVAGCVGPRPSIMPKVSTPFLVLDVESGLPVPGASVYMQYDGPSGQQETRGPFLSDEAGRGQISLKKEVLWVSWSEAYFSGGFLRSILVLAPGYEDGGLNEGFDYGAFDKQRQFTFRLTPFRNRFGGVVVAAERRDAGRHILELRIIDGPHGGESYELPVFNPPDDATAYLGGKFYLRQSIESIEAEKAKYRKNAFNFGIILRKGFPNEPYESQ
jgi:hypothetical protein